MAWLAAGSEYHGELLLNGVPVPGVSVTATNGKQEITTTSDERGAFSFPDLPDGSWTFEVSMTGFAVTKHEVTVNKDTPPAKWDLTLLPAEQTMSQVAQSKVTDDRAERSARPATRRTSTRLVIDQRHFE
jgi:hypothetical protein